MHTKKADSDFFSPPCIFSFYRSNGFKFFVCVHLPDFGKKLNPQIKKKFVVANMVMDAPFPEFEVGQSSNIFQTCGLMPVALKFSMQGWYSMLC